MDIKRIFADKFFYSFKYDESFSSIYDRKLYEWADFEFIFQKAVENNIDLLNVDQFFDEIFFDREYLKKEIERCAETNELYTIFKSLNDYSSKIVAYEESKAKFHTMRTGKRRLSRLRLYSLRANNHCFIVTGGAIKFSNRMEDHPDTLKELELLRNGRQYLIDNEFLDDDIDDKLFESNYGKT